MSANDSQSALELLLLNNYMSLVIVTAVTYDYLLTFPREIKYIWSRPWTWVSTFFVIVRYVGLCWVMTVGLTGSSFIPGPEKLYVYKLATLEVPRRRGTTETWNFEGVVSNLLQVWSYPIFMLASDLVMLLRVYAIWNRSKTIFYALLSIYVPEVIIWLVLTAIYGNLNTHYTVTVTQVSYLSFCNSTYRNAPSMVYLFLVLPELVFSTVLMVLAIARILKQSIEMYKATKVWNPNRYLQRLVGQGILYFLVNLSFDIVFAVLNGGSPTNTSAAIFLGLSIIASYIMMPRFIIGVRVLYDHDVRDHLQDIDTGFGLGSQFIASRSTAVSAVSVVFTDIAPDRGETPALDAGQSESLELEERKAGVSVA